MNLTDAERERLIEQVASAARERDAHGNVKDHPAWHDLDAADRVRAFDLATFYRSVESHAAGGMSGTARAVLERIRAAR